MIELLERVLSWEMILLDLFFEKDCYDVFENDILGIEQNIKIKCKEFLLVDNGVEGLYKGSGNVVREDSRNLSYNQEV